MTQRRVIPQLIAGIINANGQTVSAFVENYSTVAVSMATTGAPDADTGALTAGDVVGLNLYYA